MGLLDKSGFSHHINIPNAILRFLQYAFGAVAIGIVSVPS